MLIEQDQKKPSQGIRETVRKNGKVPFDQKEKPIPALNSKGDPGLKPEGVLATSYSVSRMFMILAKNVILGV